MSARCTRCGRPYAECPCGWPRMVVDAALTASAVACVTEVLFDGAPSARSAWPLLLALALREVT